MIRNVAFYRRIVALGSVPETRSDPLLIKDYSYCTRTRFGIRAERYSTAALLAPYHG